MVYIVYIKHNNMEMKKKKKVLVLYPSELSISYDRRRVI